MAAWRRFLLAATSAVFDGRRHMLNRPVFLAIKRHRLGTARGRQKEHLVAVEKRPTLQCRSLTAMTRSRRACQAGPARRAGGARRVTHKRRSHPNRLPVAPCHPGNLQLLTASAAIPAGFTQVAATATTDNNLPGQ